MFSDYQLTNNVQYFAENSYGLTDKTLALQEITVWICMGSEKYNDWLDTILHLL